MSAAWPPGASECLLGSQARPDQRRTCHDTLLFLMHWHPMYSTPFMAQLEGASGQGRCLLERLCSP